MIVETGHYALVLAFSVALFQTILPLWGVSRRDDGLIGTAVPLALAQFFLVLLSFGALTYAHVASDFSLVNVVENSHSAKPLIYKISGVWGNHEGSMMLWVLILALFGGLAAVCVPAMPQALRAAALGVQASIAAAFLLFILVTSNPFARLDPAPIEGQDLNPILQDPGLAIHPPLLYVGYVGFSIAFSFAIAALIEGRLDAAWARWVRPWVLVAWIFLTLGIAMGSYWAYYTLGWGGFWFWDPVENASLMPWLAGTALLHSIAVMEKRDALKIWTVFLALLAFSLSLLGTFLVRSGVLTSVHAFASDPTRGIFILVILVFFIGGSLGLFAWRAPLLKPGGIFAPVSREGALILNNLFLTVSCATVFVGTLYPLVLESLTGAKISVGAPYYSWTFLPLALPLLALVPIGQSLAWKRGDLLGAAQRLTVAFGCGLGAAVLLLAAVRPGPTLGVLAVGLAIYLIIGAFSEIFSRLRGRGAGGARQWVGRAFGLPRSAWGTALAHAGLGLSVLGLAATGWGVERILPLHPGESVEVGPYQVTLIGLFPRQGPNFHETVARVSLAANGQIFGTLEPSKRQFTVRQMATTEAGIRTLGLGQLYISPGEQNGDGSIDLRLYWKPLVTLIWGGALVMGLGGLLSLSDRRIRLGAARRARNNRRALTPGQPQPAE
jgi:cytochrome c-type biogenesis protein CcmF